MLDAKHGEAAADVLHFFWRRAATIANDDRVVERRAAEGRGEVDRRRVVAQRADVEQQQVELLAKVVNRIS